MIRFFPRSPEAAGGAWEGASANVISEVPEYGAGLLDAFSACSSMLAAPADAELLGIEPAPLLETALRVIQDTPRRTAAASARPAPLASLHSPSQRLRHFPAATTRFRNRPARESLCRG